MKILRRKIQGATYMPPNPYDRGPEDKDEPKSESVTDKFQITFDTVIEIDNNGDWAPVDEEFKFLKSSDSKDGNWYSDEYPSAMVADMDAIIDAFDQVVTPEIDAEPHAAGKYTISGTAYLVFNSEIEYDYEESEDDYGSDWKSKVDITDVESKFSLRDSDLTNFKIEANVSSASIPRDRENTTYDIIYAGDELDDEYEPYTGEHDEYEDVWDSIADIDQEFTSANTSINSSKLPALFSLVEFDPETVNVDYGGGRFDNVADYLTDFDVVNLVIDPFNRNKKHNRDAINLIRDHGGADSATCSNVLNVIKEPENRRQVLENMKKLVKPGGKIYITVYEGDGTGEAGATSSGYQLRRKTKEYLDEIREVFPDAERKGKLISATNSGKMPNTPTL